MRLHAALAAADTAAELHTCQQALRRAEELLEAIGQVAAIGGWDLDLVTNELRWTAATYRIHGLPLDYRPTLEAAIGFFRPDARSVVRAALSGATATGAGWDVELPFVSADGRQLWVRAVGRVTHRDGRPVRASGILQDVTERNREQAALQHSQKMNAIGSLAAGVAHDFNNILQSITGGLEIVLDDLDPGTPAHEMAGMGMRSAQRGSQLAHHLLSFSRKELPQPQTVNLATLLADIEPLLGRTLGPQIVISLQVSAELPDVLADPGQLETALLNLAINAAHAMPDGGALVIAACPVVADGAHWISLSVTDTGSGMDAATLAQATEPFFSTKGQNGTGLGLPMVRGFVEQAGGRLRLASTPGQGTRVELQLPPATRPTALLGVVARLRIRRCILLVDNEPGGPDTAGGAPERAGFAAQRVSDGDGDGDSTPVRLAAVGPRPADHLMPSLDDAGLSAEVPPARPVRPGLPPALTNGPAQPGNVKSLPPEAALLRTPPPREGMIAALQRMWKRRLHTAG